MFVSWKVINGIKSNCSRLGQGKQSIRYLVLGMAQEQNNVFNGKLDRFNGITVMTSEEKCDTIDFPNKLKNSLKLWMERNHKTIWFKVDIRDSECVPMLAKNGFSFHHARNTYVMMYKWLPSTENCNVPPYAHTLIGVGGIVINDQEEILAISEKYHKVPHFKLPGGFVEPNENLTEAVIREVYEETGVQTTFDGLIGFRHIHNSQFDCSDIYYVCSLKPSGSTELRKCEQEIDKCVWMKIDEYVKHPHVHDLNKMVIRKYLEYKENRIQIKCSEGTHPTLVRPYAMFFVNKM